MATVQVFPSADTARAAAPKMSTGRPPGAVKVLGNALLIYIGATRAKAVTPAIGQKIESCV